MALFSRLIGFAFTIAATPPPYVAHAQVGYEAPTLEWLIADSDVVVRATIVDVEPTPIPNPDPQTFRNPEVRKTVTLTVHETLKGDPADSLTFLEDRILASNRIYEAWRDAELELLWFFKCETATGADDGSTLKPYELEWSAIRLGPKVPEEGPFSGPPPIFNLRLEPLVNPQEILDSARRAVEALGASMRVQGHRINLPRTIMARSGKSGDVNQLTVPVYARLEGLAHQFITRPWAFLYDSDMMLTAQGRNWLVDQLRLEGVRALEYFPSEDNAFLLRSLLNDEAWSIHNSPDGEKRKVYYIREAAEDILRSWAGEVDDVDDLTGTLWFTWEGDVDGVTDITASPHELSHHTTRHKPPTGVRHVLHNSLPRSGEYEVVIDSTGRGEVSIVQQPTLDNENTAIIRIDDDRPLGRGAYKVTARFRPRIPESQESEQDGGENVPEAHANELGIQLLPYPEEKSLFHWNPVLVRFTNRDTQELRILRPLDGSEWSWHMPYYRFTVRDADGHELELTPRCGISGLWANVVWPRDYMILLGPGDSYEMQVGIYQVIPEDGEYTVSFEYIYDSEVAAR